MLKNKTYSQVRTETDWAIATLLIEGSEAKVNMLDSTSDKFCGQHITNSDNIKRLCQW